MVVPSSNVRVDEMQKNVGAYLYNKLIDYAVN